MSYSIVGLGNPGEEYTETRHNAGRIALERFRVAHDFPDWKTDMKSTALVSSGTLGKEKISLIEPEGFMNNSGKSLRNLITSEKKAETLIVIHDDLDLPFGTFKITFNRGSGGHRGLESIIRAIKTKAFIRIRIGISPTTPSGKLKKPQGEKAVGDFILGTFKKTETDMLKKITKQVTQAIDIIISDGREKAMGEFN